MRALQLSHTRLLKHTLRIVIWLTLSALLVTCASDDPSQPNGQDFGKDSVHVDIEWRTEVVKLDQQGMYDVLRIDSVSQRYYFRESSTAAAALKAGDIVVFGDYMIRRVRSVAQNGGELVVETDFIPFTDAVKNADITWNKTVQWSAASFANALGKQGHKVQVVTGDSIKTSLKSGDYLYVVEGKFYGDKVAVSLTATEHIGTKPVASLKFTGELKNFLANGNVQIQDGELQEFDASAKGIDGKFTIEGTVIGAEVENFEDFIVPLTLFKFPIAGLPFFLFNIKFVVVMDAYLPDSYSTVGFKATFDYAGDQGFSFGGASTVFPSAELKRESVVPVDQQHVGGLTPTGVSWGVGFPHFEVELLNTTLGWVRSSYLVGADYVPPPPLTNECQRVVGKLIGSYGWALGAFGYSVVEGADALWIKEYEFVKNGPGCPQ